MSERNIAWAVRVGASVTLLVLLCVVTPVYLWIRAHGEIDGTAALTFAIVLPLTITPTLSVIMLRTRLKVYRLAEENFRIAHMDELTGLPNRRAFFEGARQLQARADFTHRLFFCAIADVDDFKRVNDTRGHDVGDHVLREIAALLNTRAPDDCIVARLGGEEFALAGIFASEAEASEAFDRLVAQVAATSVQIEGGRLSVTISLGYCRGHRLNEISTLLSRADRALYVAKNFGKNRVMSYEAAVAKSEADAA